MGRGRAVKWLKRVFCFGNTKTHDRTVTVPPPPPPPPNPSEVVAAAPNPSEVVSAAAPNPSEVVAVAAAAPNPSEVVAAAADASRAAVRIQAAFRGFLARKLTQRIKKTGKYISFSIRKDGNIEPKCTTKDDSEESENSSSASSFTFPVLEAMWSGSPVRLGSCRKTLGELMKLEKEVGRPHCMIWKPRPSKMWCRLRDSLSMNKLNLDDNVRKPSNGSEVHLSGFNNHSQGPQVRTQGRGQGYREHMPSLPASHPSHSGKVTGSQHNAARGSPFVQSGTQSYSQSPFRPAPKQIGDGSQASSLQRGYVSQNSMKSGEKCQSESGKVWTAVVGKTAGAVQGALGPFMYNGAQIMAPTGSMGAAHGDPTILPVTRLFRIFDSL